jgi:hypothetical protein
MLTLTISGEEIWNEETQEFIYPDTATIELEHSLVSLSKWESKFEKPFLGSDEKTTEEVLGYIEMMSLTPNVPPEVYRSLSDSQMEQVNEYIKAKMTATTIKRPDEPGRGKPKEIITAEIVYYWMISLEIPIEFQYWHINRLFTLIEVVNLKNNPPKKTATSKRNQISERARINAQRRAEMQSSG